MHKESKNGLFNIQTDESRHSYEMAPRMNSILAYVEKIVIRDVVYGE